MASGGGHQNIPTKVGLCSDIMITQGGHHHCWTPRRTLPYSRPAGLLATSSWPCPSSAPCSSPALPKQPSASSTNHIRRGVHCGCFCILDQTVAVVTAHGRKTRHLAPSHLRPDPTDWNPAGSPCPLPNRHVQPGSSLLTCSGLSHPPTLCPGLPGLLGPGKPTMTFLAQNPPDTFMKPRS